MDVSKRGAQLPPSPIRKLKPLADSAIQRGIRIYALNIGQPDIETPKPMLNVLKNIDKKVIDYGPSQGLEQYRNALVRYYGRHGIELDPSQIIVTTGGSEAITMAFTVCCDPGDEVLVPQPFYTNYNGFAIAAGVKLKPITTTLENNWDLPPIESLEGLITEKTKAFMVCNPNNPTGKVYSRQELEKLAVLAKKHDIFLLGDEVYREFIFSGEKHVSLLDLEGVQDRVIVMDSISKRFSACGLRIGAFISRNQTVMQAALCYAQARLCPPTIDQLVATPSVDLGDGYFKTIIDEYKRRRDAVIEDLKTMDGVRFQVPDGAFYIIVKLPVADTEAFVSWMLSSFDVDGETVMLAPAQGFYATPGLGRDEVRIAFVLGVEKIKRAMEILRLGLEEYTKITS